ncbi:MAG: Crp/Fnr family transcriptional regulator [Clostridia bacterium]|nr:Crp/Fnr family transcriptional regulator [Clostridia bacterium]
MKKYSEILRKCPLFDGIEEDEISAMLSCLGARVDHFDKRYTIFAEGRPAKYIGIVLSGKAQIELMDYFGNRSIIATIGEAELFGEAFACAEMNSLPVSVVASESCEVMIIDVMRIMHTCEKRCGFHERLIFNLMKDLASKAVIFQRKLEIVTKRSTREKLLTYLTMQAKVSGTKRMEIPFDRQGLADYLGVDRSGLSAEIGKLRTEGVLRCRKNVFELI